MFMVMNKRGDLLLFKFWSELGVGGRGLFNDDIGVVWNVKR